MKKNTSDSSSLRNLFQSLFGKKRDVGCTPSHSRIRVLFILRNRNLPYGISYGLSNSCIFLANALSHIGIEAKVVNVGDNNDIDREVHRYQPTHVLIEALWVTPSKFNVLLTKYPKVEWNVRIHSKIPFISHEGIAIEWIKKYFEVAKAHKNFSISANNLDIIEQIQKSLGLNLVYLPNVYCPNPCNFFPKRKKGNELHIGCFGSIRPLKNHLIQAISAIIFANSMGKQLFFHINSGRIEQHGEPILKNLRNLFKDTHHKLIEHDWLNHHEFVELVQEMDIGMQVSMSESFNIVTADFVWNNIPVIGSREIEWLHVASQAETTNYKDILEKLRLAFFVKEVVAQNKHNLEAYNNVALQRWLSWLKH